MRLAVERSFRLSFLATGEAVGAVESTRMRKPRTERRCGDEEIEPAEKVCVFSSIED